MGKTIEKVVTCEWPERVLAGPGEGLGYKMVDVKADFKVTINVDAIVHEVASYARRNHSKRATYRRNWVTAEMIGEPVEVEPCGHSACSQHYIDSGSRECVKS